MSKIRGHDGEEGVDADDETGGRGSRIGSRLDDSLIEEENDPFKKAHSEWDSKLIDLGVTQTNRPLSSVPYSYQVQSTGRLHVYQSR
jgi:hypothetical protein